tara:strand:- start:422 stop:568 length:147 start_codon:yes stop_codon:yes gene_type:complete
MILKRQHTYGIKISKNLKLVGNKIYLTNNTHIPIGSVYKEDLMKLIAL